MSSCPTTSSIVTSSNPRSLKSWIALARIFPRSLLFFSARKPISCHVLLRLRSTTGSRPEPSHDERRVVPPEGEGVAQGDPDLLPAARVRYVVEVALGVGCIVVQRRGEHSSPHGETTDGGLERRRCSGSVSHDGFRRAHGNRVCPRTEHALDRDGLEDRKSVV